MAARQNTLDLMGRILAILEGAPDEWYGPSALVLLLRAEEKSSRVSVSMVRRALGRLYGCGKVLKDSDGSYRFDPRRGNYGGA